MTVAFRRARPADLTAIVALLRDDALGAGRESADLQPYASAFADIDGDPRHLLVVGELDGEVIACLQATVLPSLTHGGRRRAQIEGVRVHGAHRGAGVGRSLLAWTIDWAGEQGCGVMQLTTDKARPDALRFYESLGFAATHEGLKRTLG
ncbi:GNAT family N-acetyltransferase [Aquihabitans daechungensis]|uniref:GNAT family N-acetyltransferase n=1 Tax=Aquihabitans daechungensis TaxID=1052257 RepID=UPI003B9E671D